MRTTFPKLFIKCFLLACIIFSQILFAQNDPINNTFGDITDDRARVDSLNSLGYNLWIKSPSKSVTLGNLAAQISSEIGYEQGLAKAKRVSGVGHWAMGEPRLALEDLYESKKKYGVLADALGEANATLNMGMVYAEIDEDSTALKLYRDAVNQFTALNQQDRIATAYTKIGGLYLKNANYQDALFNLTNALKIHTDNNFEYGMAEAHNRLGTLYIEQKELEQADYHLRNSLAISRKIEDKDGIVSSMVQYGRLQRLKGEYEVADIHYKWALEEASRQRQNNYRLLALESLADLKKDLNQPDSALFYYQSYISSRDSIYNLNKSKQIAAMEFQQDLLQKETELSYLSERNKTNRQIQWILFIGIWIILLLALFVFKFLRQRSKNEKLLLEQKQKLATTALKEEEVKNFGLQQELEIKNKELSSYALNFVQKNEFIEELRNRVEDLKKDASPKASKKLLEMDKLLRIQQSKDKDWDEFLLHFENVHTSFFTNLKTQYPELSQNDLKVAALTRLNLSIKETSDILGISAESTKTARYRLRKKLNLSPETDLFDFLITF